MTLPTVPTKTSIVTEALKMAGYSSPTADEIARAGDEWLEEVKGEIWSRAFANGNTRLRTLLTSNIQISVANKSEYGFPSDFDEELLIEVLDGKHTGTAQSSTNTTITLAADEDVSQKDAEGRYILITGGTGKTQLRQITAYNPTTKVATVDSSWGTAPDNTSTYLIVDRFYPIDEKNITELGINRVVPGRPTFYHRVNEGMSEKLIFDRPFDKSTYGIRIRYFANIHKIDLTEGNTLISRIYQNWHHVLKQGVLVKALKNDDDDKYPIEKGIFDKMVNELLIREIPYGGEFEGFEVG